jgi:anthranilate phosphoribosyltransferase
VQSELDSFQIRTPIDRCLFVKSSETEVMAPGVEPSAPQHISITPLLRRLWPSPSEGNVTAEEIALAISHIFTDQLSPVQTGALLTCLHFTGWDRRADVIAKCAEAMREAAAPIDNEALLKVVKEHGRPEGHYAGGLVSCIRKI